MNLTLWILQGLAALVFLVFGASKLDPHQKFWIGMFSRIGLGQWFRYFTGSLEVVCAFLLLIPKTCVIAALLLACTMVGAVLTHSLVLREPSVASFGPIALLLLMLVVAGWRLTERQTHSGN